MFISNTGESLADIILLSFTFSIISVNKVKYSSKLPEVQIRNKDDS